MSTYKHLKSFRLRQKILALHYKGNRCCICGYNTCKEALVFHHLDPSQKSFTISTSSKSFLAMIPELDKCILVCNRCHTEIHCGLITIPGVKPKPKFEVRHGVITTYFAYRCRCISCCEAAKIYRRQRYKSGSQTRNRT